MNTVVKIKISKGDKVVVRSGSQKGKVGKVTAVHRSENKVTVEGVNVAKKHQKPNRQYPQGGIIEITKPIWVSNVAVFSNQTTKKPEKISYKQDKDGKKYRVFKSNGKKVDV